MGKVNKRKTGKKLHIGSLRSSHRVSYVRRLINRFGILVCFLLGVSLICWPFVNQWLSTRVSIPNDPAVFVKAAITTQAAGPSTDFVAKAGKPIRVIVPRLEIDIPVKSGVFDPVKKTWTLSDNNAHWASATPQPNNLGGNTFIYGHNMRSVFSLLPKIQPGDVVFVDTENGLRFSYLFSGAKQTTPDDVSLFQYQGKPILTLQTCTGPRFEHRMLFVFDFVGVRP